VFVVRGGAAVLAQVRWPPAPSGLAPTTNRFASLKGKPPPLERKQPLLGKKAPPLKRKPPPLKNKTASTEKE
jgi:hypothetical protein